MNKLKHFRRLAVLNIHTAICWNITNNELHIYTDGGRLMRPLYYLENGKPSFDRAEMVTKLNEGKLSWKDIVCGFKEKQDPVFSIKSNI